MTDHISTRVRDAQAADRAELAAVYRRIIRTPEDCAALMIAEYEAETGMAATLDDWVEARAEVARQMEKTHG